MKKLLLSLAAVALGFTANAGEVVFDFTADNYGLTPYNADLDNNSPYIQTPASITQDDVKITFDGAIDGNTTGWRMWSDGLREYSKRNPSFTVTTTNGEKVTYVTWTGNSVKFALEGSETSILGWEGSEDSVTFVNVTDGNKAIYTLTVGYGDYEGDEIPETPDAPQGVISVAEALQYIENGYTDAATVEGYIVAIEEVNLEYGNATYTIADNASDKEGLVIFRGYYLENAKFTSVDQLEVGAKVVVKGNLMNYNGTPEMGSGSVLVSYNGETDAPENPENPGDEYIFAESFSTSLGDFDIVNETLPEELSYVWSFANNYGAKASAYLNGNFAAESWLVSPVIDLEGYTDVVLSFEHAINYANGNKVTDFCQVYVCEVVNDKAGEWINLSSEVVYPEGNNWTFVNSGEISLEACEGKQIQIGFLYNSTSEVAPTWEIKNLIVSGNQDENNGVEGIEIDVNAPVYYYNLQGVRVNNPVKGGLYIIRQGNKSTKAIVR